MLPKDGVAGVVPEFVEPPNGVCPKVEVGGLSVANPDAPKPSAAVEGLVGSPEVDPTEPNAEVPPNADGPVFAKAPNPVAGLIAAPNELVELEAGAAGFTFSGTLGNEPNIPTAPNPGLGLDSSPLPPRDRPPRPELDSVGSAAIRSSELDTDTAIGEARG